MSADRKRKNFHKPVFIFGQHLKLLSIAELINFLRLILVERIMVVDNGSFFY